jgi:O-antigen ligase
MTSPAIVYRSRAKQRSFFHVPSILLFAFFVCIGVAATTLFAKLSARHSAFLVFILLLLVPPSLLLAFVGVPAVLAKARSMKSQLTMWHGLWALLFISGLVLRIRDVQDINQSPADSAAAFRIVLVSIVGFTLVGMLGLRRHAWFGSLFGGLVGFMTVYCVASLISTIWSVYPSWTLYKSIEYLVDVSMLAAFVALVRSAEDYKSFFDWTWTLYGLLLGAVWLSAMIVPSEGFMREGHLRQDIGTLSIQLEGVFPKLAANRVGDLGALLTILALCRLFPIPSMRARLKSDRIWYFCLFLFAAASLFLSQTRSALAAFLFGFVVWLVLCRRWKTLVALPVLASTILVSEHVRDKVWDALHRGQSNSEFDSISGRLDWWTFAWHKLMQHPWTGLGAYAGGRFAVMSGLGDTSTSSVHSDYVEILVGTSIWGLLPIAIVLIGSWWILARYYHKPGVNPENRQLALEAIAMLGVLSVRTFFSDIMTFHAALMFLVIVGLAEVLRRQQKLSRSPALSNHFG